MWMGDLLKVDLFGEDHAHEELIGAMIKRIFLEKNLYPLIRSRSVKGGYPKMLSELDTFQKLVQRKQMGLDIPDVLVVVQDTNCAGYNTTHKTLKERINYQIFPSVALACPDPYIERWFFADPESFHKVIGVGTALERKKCERNFYKQKLANEIRKGGHPIRFGGIEFASELVEAMDLYKARKNEETLNNFISELQEALARFS